MRDSLSLGALDDEGGVPDGSFSHDLLHCVLGRFRVRSWRSPSFLLLAVLGEVFAQAVEAALPARVVLKRPLTPTLSPQPAKRPEERGEREKNARRSAPSRPAKRRASAVIRPAPPHGPRGDRRCSPSLPDARRAPRPTGTRPGGRSSGSSRPARR